MLLIFSISAQTMLSTTDRNALAALPDFNFGAAGDWGRGTNAQNTAKNMANHNVELAVGLGDYAYDTGSSAVNSWWNNDISPWLGGKFKGALGNHDVDDKSTYASKFEQTNTWYFSFDRQNIHFLAIDAYSSFGPGSSQYKFVKNDLTNAASNPNIDWIVVFYHPPIYASPGSHSGNSGLRDAFHPLFDQYGVDLVLQGHNHNYERSYPINHDGDSTPIIVDTNKNTYNDPAGTIFVTVGTGGRNLYSFDSKASYIVTQNDNDHGYLDVSVTNDGKTMKGTFYSNDGDVLDSFTIDKSGSTDPPSTTPYHYEPYFTATGSNYHDSPNSSSLQLSKFTLGAWFRTTKDYSTSAIIAAKGGLGSDNTGKNMNYGIRMTPDQKIAAGFETSSGVNIFAISPNSYNDGKWHYAMVTYGGYTVYLYIDGVRVAQKDVKVTPDNTGTQPLRVGANSILSDSYFIGSIDEVRVWNRALTSTEAASAYKGTIPTNGQVLHLSFDTSAAPTTPTESPSNTNPLQFSTFTKSPADPLLLGHTEPDIIKVGDTYYMYYRNDATSKPSIAVASSSDGIQWQERGTVLTASSSGFDSAEVIAPSVLYDNGKYYLFYEADDASHVGQRRIGVASSASPTGPFTKHGIALNYEGGWEGTIVGTPSVAKIGDSKYYLFYHGYSGGSDRIGVAYASNPMGPFSKEPNNPILDIGQSGAWDDNKVAPSSIYVDRTNVIVFYEGFDGVQEHIRHWRVGIADGKVDPTDGRIKSLIRRAGNPIINLGSSGSWDDTTVQLPSAIRVGDEMWVYYSGNDGSAFRVGRAIAKIM